jgi:nitrogen fixation protein FixH
MEAGDLIAGIGLGVVLELLGYVVLTKGFKLQAKAAAMVVAMLAVLVYVPWALAHRWPGADIFAVHLAIYLTLAYGLGMVGSSVGKGWHWAPALIVTFFVGVIVINIVFVVVAQRGITGVFSELLPEPDAGEVADSKFPGTVSHDFQEKEALYNRYLEQVQAQHARGWQVRYGWLGKPKAREPADLVVLVHDRDGKPVSGAKVSGRFLRTSNSREDFDFEMREYDRGEYKVRLAMPLHGLWRMVLSVRRGEDHHEIRALTSVLSNPENDRP